MPLAAMGSSDWIALAALIMTLLGVAVYLGRIIGALPGQIAEAVRIHERSCANYEPHTSPRMAALQGGNAQPEVKP